MYDKLMGQWKPGNPLHSHKDFSVETYDNKFHIFTINPTSWLPFACMPIWRRIEAPLFLAPALPSIQLIITKQKQENPLIHSKSIHILTLDSTNFWGSFHLCCNHSCLPLYLYLNASMWYFEMLFVYNYKCLYLNA